MIEPAVAGAKPASTQAREAHPDDRSMRVMEWAIAITALAAAILLAAIR